MKRKPIRFVICLILIAVLAVPASATELNGGSVTGGQQSVTPLDPNCTHEFGDWTVDGETHKRVCGLCSGVESADHSYSGWQARGGTHVRSCADCGNSQREGHTGQWTPNGATHRMNCSTCGTILDTQHSYGDWSNSGEGHSHTCTGCGQVETLGHSWSEADASGNKSCTACGAVSAHSHSFGSWTESGSGHKRICSCGQEETGEHSWSEADASGNKSCTACGAVSTHSHSFGSWTESGSGHKRICSCGQEETGEHSWSEADANGNKTCSLCSAVLVHEHSFGSWTAADGKHSRTCSGCSKTETADHSYGDWTKDGQVHTRVCSVCDDTQTGDHTWDTGVVVKEATCKEEGRKEYLCTLCNAGGVEYLDKTNTHTYENDCDDTCDVCEAKRNVKHSYNEQWSRDSSGHWHVCTVCGDRTDDEAHTAGAAATETRDQVCTVCSYVIEPRKTHVHSYATSLTKDEKGHWYACGGCETQKDYKVHFYANTCDGTCDDCGYTRKIQHTYGQEWSSDANGHWNLCAVCKAKSDISPHTPGPAATEQNAQVCTVCSYELVAKLEKETQVAAPDASWKSDDASHWQLSGSGEKLHEALHTWDLGTENRDGSVTYTCTVCQAERTQQNTEADAEEESGGFSWAILLLVVLIVLFIGTAVALVIAVYMARKKGDLFGENKDEFV